MATLLPGQATLADIRDRARVRADRRIRGASTLASPDPYANAFVTTDQLNSMVNGSMGEIIELLANQFSNYWFVAQYQWTTTANTDRYAVPNDMLKHLSVEWVQSAGSVINNVVLRRFNFNERDKFNYYAFAPPIFSLGAAMYSIVGKEIWFRPIPSGGLTFLMNYVPVPAKLIDSGTITMNTVLAGDTLTITLDGGAATTYTAIAHGGSPTSSQFVIGGTGADNGDAGTAQSLASTLTTAYGGKAGVMSFVATPATGTTTGTASVAVLLTGPATVTWSSSGSTLVLSPNSPTGALGTGPIKWSNIFDGYAGLDEYMVVDAALKMTEMENSPVDALMAAKAALIQRYKENYTNRDPGQPRTPTNTRRQWYGSPGNGWAPGSL